MDDNTKKFVAEWLKTIWNQHTQMQTKFVHLILAHVWFITGIIILAFSTRWTLGFIPLFMSGIMFFFNEKR